MSLVCTTNQLWNYDIVSWISVAMIEQYSDIQWKRTINLWEGSVLSYVAIVDNAQVDIEIVSTGSWCQSHISVIVLSHDGVMSGGRYVGVLWHDHTETDLHIVSLLTTDAVITVDGSVDIRSDVRWVSGHLLEENLILWNNIKLKTLPMLDVRSNDVRASHGARIERIDDKKLFYMMSKGISKTDARRLMIEGLVGVLFDRVRESDKDFVSSVQSDVITKVYQK